jgi:hypothetical protein
MLLTLAPVAAASLLRISSRQVILCAPHTPRFANTAPSKTAMRFLPVPTHTTSLRSRRTKHPKATLELHQLDHFHDQAERALTDTIDAYGQLDAEVDTSRWKSLRSRQGVRLFRGRQPNGRGLVEFMCVGTLHGFDDVMEGLYCDNTEDMLLMNAIKCPRLAESAVLHTAEKKSPLEPYAFTGIKWATIKLPVASNRDVCYFDKMGMMHQAQGKRMAYHVMQSVNLPEYPLREMVYKRVEMSLCYVLEELEDDLVGVYMRGEVDGAALSYFATKALSDVLLGVACALKCTRAKKLTIVVSSPPLGFWQSTSSGNNCYVCRGSVSFFESLTFCAGCNKKLCKKCRYTEPILHPALPNGRLKQVDFCGVCVSRISALPIDSLRSKTQGPKDSELTSAIADSMICQVDEETEMHVEGSSRSLRTFVHNMSTHVQVLSSHSEVRASNLSSMGCASLSDEENEALDVLNASRLKSNQLVTLEKTPVDMQRRSRSSTTSTTSSFGFEEEDAELYQTSLMAKLQQVSQQVEKTLLFAREQSASRALSGNAAEARTEAFACSRRETLKDKIQALQLHFL